MDGKTTLTVAQVIEKAGGAKQIADASQRFGEPFSKDAVYKWLKSGIPDRHWAIIISLSGLSVEAIYGANVDARSPENQVAFKEAAE